jgi:hypothetical protein
MDNNQNQSATPPVTAPDPNDLSTDMTEEELQSFVNNHLGEPASAPEAPPVAPPATELPAPEPPAPEAPPAPVTPPPKPTPPAPEPEPLPDSIDTSDLWIETQMPDTVDANGNTIPGKTVRLGVDDDLPDDFKFKSDKHLFEVQQAISEMRQEKANREAKLESDHSERASEEATKQATLENNKKLDAEISALIDIGVLDKPKVATTDPKFLEDPAIQKIDAVLKFMTADNAKRTEEGRPLLNSFGVALTAYSKQSPEAQQTEADRAAAAQKKAEDDETKRRGALVGGGSATPTSSGKKVYEAGSAKSIYDIEIPDE